MIACIFMSPPFLFMPPEFLNNMKEPNNCDPSEVSLITKNLVSEFRLYCQNK